MIVLVATTDILKFITSSAANIDWLAHYAGAVKASGATDNLDRAFGTVASATTTTVLAGPGSSSIRAIEFATWRNKHASLACDITVEYETTGPVLTEIHKETLQPGECLQYIKELGFFKLAAASSGFNDILARYVRGAAGQNIATVQPWFPSNGAVALEAGTTYSIDGYFQSTRAAGAVSHTTGVGFGGTATLTSFRMMGQCGEGDVATINDSDALVWTSAANLNIKAASTSATEVIKFAIHSGIVEVNAAGTFIPQFTYSAVPGGAPTIDAFFKLVKLGSGFASKGTWT